VLDVNQWDNYGNFTWWGFPFEFGDIRFREPDTRLALERVDKAITGLRKYARTPFLLLNNGWITCLPSPCYRVVETVGRELYKPKEIHQGIAEMIHLILPLLFLSDRYRKNCG